jgi:hypothetical protein
MRMPEVRVKSRRHVRFLDSITDVETTGVRVLPLRGCNTGQAKASQARVSQQKEKNVATLRRRGGKSCEGTTPHSQGTEAIGRPISVCYCSGGADGGGAGMHVRTTKSGSHQASR